MSRAVSSSPSSENSSLLGGGGVDGAIHRAGGKAILDDCRKIVARQGGCKVGQAVVTTAGDLPARLVIHTVGPVWNGGHKGEKENLASCYRNSLLLALQNQCKSIAFPGISTGIYKFPKELAAKIAVSTVTRFLTETNLLEKVVFVCFDDENYQYISHELSLYA